MYGVASDLSRGAFSHAVLQDAASGEAQHAFACAACVPHDLSTLRFSLARECEASAVLTVSAVGAWGSVTATSQLVGGAALGGGVSLAVPVTFEVLQDLSWSDYASALQASGVLAAGGKSARGLGVGAAQGLAQTAPPAGADPQAALPLAERTVEFTLSLPLQPSFVLATLSLRTSWPGCEDALATELLPLSRAQQWLSSSTSPRPAAPRAAKPLASPRRHFLAGRPRGLRACRRLRLRGDRGCRHCACVTRPARVVRPAKLGACGAALVIAKLRGSSKLMAPLSSASLRFPHSLPTSPPPSPPRRSTE